MVVPRKRGAKYGQVPGRALAVGLSVEVVDAPQVLADEARKDRLCEPWLESAARQEDAGHHEDLAICIARSINELMWVAREFRTAPPGTSAVSRGERAGCGTVKAEAGSEVTAIMVGRIAHMQCAWEEFNQRSPAGSRSSA